MRIIRLLGNVALWIGAVLGVIAGGVWAAGQLGWVQPLIVISGSMEPNIHTGDLIIGRNLATGDVQVGDVVSLRSEMTDKLVTHRVTEISPNDDGTWQIEMQGDANDEPDLETYTVASSVLTPMLRVPMGGTVVSKLMEPAVALPILLALVALLGVSLLDEEPRKAIRRTIDRVGRRSPELDELDRKLAAVGVDVSQFREMDDLDLALLAVGVDVGAFDDDPPERAGNILRDEHRRPPRDDAMRSPDVSPEREPALSG